MKEWSKKGRQKKRIVMGKERKEKDRKSKG